MAENKRMTFQEIKRNKDKFLDQYKLREEFEKSGYTWKVLMEIASQYDSDRTNVYPDIIKEYITQISKFDAIHSYRYRIKDTDSLIKKIITKANTKDKRVTPESYLYKITDLLGIRVLYHFKEDYYKVHQQLMDAYQPQLVENVHIKLQTGDDKSIYEKILGCDPVIEENNTYRSIHYTLNTGGAKSARLEIQTRTIFEEGWSEINHKLVYKNQDVADYFALTQASKILSTLVGNCDSLGTLMKNIYDEYLKKVEENQKHPYNAQDSNDIMSEVLKSFLRS